MEKTLYKVSIGLALVAVSVSCSPDYSGLVPEKSVEPVSSVTATVDLDGDGVTEEFVGYPDADGRIEISFPWFYPEDSDFEVKEETLKDVKVVGSLANNVTVEPPLLRMDLTAENPIVATDQVKARKNYLVTGKIAKLTGCDITSFVLQGEGLEGIINGETISLVRMEDFPSALKADVSLSPHATISPDPRETAINWNEEVELTVTAHDGVTQKIYTVVKNIPDKLRSGIRPESAKVLFEKKLGADVGISGSDNTTSIAASGNYLIINTRNQKAKVIDRMTGENVGEMAGMSSILGSLVNYYMTSDDDGNILVNNLITAAGTFRMWKFSDKDAQPEEYIVWNAPASYGRKVSVVGSLDGDAIITATCSTVPTSSFARWIVKGGVLQSQEPEIVTAGVSWDNYQADLMHVTTDPASDYFVFNYRANNLSWLSGADNTLKAKLGPVLTEFIANEIDILQFNNATLLAAQQVNTMNSGSGDLVWLLDVTTQDNFTGALMDGSLGSPTCPAVQWWTRNTYGAVAGGAPVVKNTNGVGEVLLVPSEDGYYVSLYIMFCNGYVAGVQFDCLDI